MTDMQGLFELVKKLDLLEIEKLQHLLEQRKQEMTHSKSGQRIAGLHTGAMIASPDFDDELPDAFWLGEA